MLFKLKVSEVNSTIESNASQTEELLTTVDNLQEENKKLKEYLQQLSSASTASESALDQLKTAYLMLKKIDSSQMDVLKQEVDNLYLQIKTSEVKSPEKIKNSTSNPINNKSEKTGTSKQNKSTSNSRKKDDVKAVEVEVLEPEDEDKSSHYEAVMKLKQFIN